MECCDCERYLDGDSYSTNQWRRGPGAAKCYDCVRDNQREVSCPYCDRVLNCQNSLNMHIPHCIPTCRECGRTFQSENALRQHSKIHAPRELQCPLCNSDKRYRTGANVVAHVESGYCQACRGSDNAHEQISRFVSRNAPGLLAPMLEYDSHHNNDLPQRPYRCTYCSKTFAHLSSQMNHEADVHDNNRRLNQIGW